jgi:hypothetical protein
MASSHLLTHCGACAVERAALDAVPVPPATATWFPIGHGRVLDTTLTTLAQAGFQVTRQQLAVAKEGARFFGTLDLESPVAPGVALAVGIRNSIDQSLAISFCAGSRVFICDNLAFHSEIVVSRKHTRFGGDRFQEAIGRAVGTLGQFQAKERQRIARFQEEQLTDERAEALILRSYEQGLLSYRLLPEVITAWRKPPFEEFAPRTLWSLENCFTGAFASVQRTNPQRFASVTIRLQDFLANGGSPMTRHGETPLAIST